MESYGKKRPKRIERRDEREKALRMFLDCREYGINPQTCSPEVGRELIQLLVWRMRCWNGKYQTGERHNSERVNEIRRLQKGLGRPIFRRRFIRTLDELLEGYNKAVSLGLISKGNAVSYGGGQFMTEDGLDESVPAQRAFEYVKVLRAEAKKHPFVWFYCFVLRLGSLPQPH